MSTPAQQCVQEPYENWTAASLASPFKGKEIKPLQTANYR